MSQIVLGPPQFLQLRGVITGDKELQRLVHELSIEYPAVQDRVDGLVHLVVIANESSQKKKLKSAQLSCRLDSHSRLLLNWHTENEVVKRTLWALNHLSLLDGLQ